MTLKLNVEKFSKSLDRFMTHDTKGITDCILKFEEDGFKVQAFEQTNTYSSSLELSKEFFVEYEQLNNIGIGNISEFISVLSKFKGDIELTVDGNLMNITKGKRSVFIELVDEDSISSTYRELKIEHENSFNLSVSDLNKVFDLASTKGMGDVKLYIKLEKGKIIFTIKGKYKFVEEIEVEDIDQDFEMKYGAPFFNALGKYLKDNKKLEGNLTIFTGEDMPIKIEVIEENLKHSLVIAPLTGDDDE